MYVIIIIRDGNSTRRVGFPARAVTDVTLTTHPGGTSLSVRVHGVRVASVRDPELARDGSPCEDAAEWVGEILSDSAAHAKLTAVGQPLVS